MDKKTKEELNLRIDSVKEDFERYLSSASSERIIFSGPFGSGKTYFLNQFFEINSKYTKILLRPVNYAVAANSDVFELIKHDLLFEILRKPDLKFEKLEFDFVLATKLYSDSKFIEILKPFLFALPEIGKTLNDISDSFEKLFNKIKAYKRKVEIDDRKEVIKFLHEVSNQKGNIYESNFITGIITQIINQLKSENRKTVLIVDDLDRIDPAHLFRILNVFASHFDEDKNTNKFEFDHLIFVCDINNVQRIYESFYGKNVDFAGYMNKFYTKEIYEFDNLKELTDSVDNWLTKIQYEGGPPRDVNVFRDYNIIWRRWLVFLLVRMIQSKKMSLRALKNQILRSYSYKPYMVSLFDGRKNSSAQFAWFILFDFLKNLFGNNTEDLSAAIADSNFNNSINENFGLSENDLLRFIGELLVLTDWRKRGLSPGTHSTIVDGRKVEYDLTIQHDYVYASLRNVSNEPNWTPSNVNYDLLIKEAYKVYIESHKTKTNLK